MKRQNQSKPTRLPHRVSKADQQNLWSYFAGLVEATATQYGVQQHEILRPGLHKCRRFTRPVVQAREEIVLLMRLSVWYRDMTERQERSSGQVHRRAVRRIVIGYSVRDDPDWKPVSYPMIAALFVSCCHSTILLIHRRAAKRAAEAAAERSNAEASDGRNRNSDSNGDVCGRGDSGGVRAQPVERTIKSVL